MSANLEAKKIVVEEIKDKISKAKSVTFVDYNGLTVEEDTLMRKAFRQANAEYKVYKNRLMLLALNELGFKGLDQYLQGTTAVAFGYEDEVAPAKILDETASKTKKMAFKFGVLNGEVIDSKEIEKLAKLPSKEVLIAMLLRTLNGPITAVCRALDAVASKE